MKSSDVGCDHKDPGSPLPLSMNGFKYRFLRLRLCGKSSLKTHFFFEESIKNVLYISHRGGIAFGFPRLLPAVIWGNGAGHIVSDVTIRRTGG